MSNLGKLLQRGWDFSARGKTPRKELRARIAAAEEKRRKEIPLMPDEEELQRARRRKASKRRGGRTSTILTGDGDRLGP